MKKRVEHRYQLSGGNAHLGLYYSDDKLLPADVRKKLQERDLPLAFVLRIDSSDIGNIAVYPKFKEDERITAGDFLLGERITKRGITAYLAPEHRVMQAMTAKSLCSIEDETEIRRLMQKAIEGRHRGLA